MTEKKTPTREADGSGGDNYVKSLNYANYAPGSRVAAEGDSLSKVGDLCARSVSPEATVNIDYSRSSMV